MFLYLSIFGSCLIFLFLTFGHLSSRPDASDFISFKFPKAFVISLVLLLLSGYTMSRTLPAFVNDDMKALKWYLGATVLLGLSFTISQYIGWYELMRSGIYLSGKAAGSYLYVITGLHILHLAGGLVALTLYYTRISRISRDAVRTLILVTNPYEKMRLEMLKTYWQFIDIIWIFLFFYFLFVF